jgi:ribosomal protein L19E
MAVKTHGYCLLFASIDNIVHRVKLRWMYDFCSFRKSIKYIHASNKIDHQKYSEGYSAAAA